MSQLSLLEKSFTVHLAEPRDIVITRAARRVIVSSDVLKSSKLCAGDVVAISNVDVTSDSEQQVYSVGVVWPSSEVEQDCFVFVSPSLLLSARLTDGSKIRITPLSLPNVPYGFPSIRHVQEAGTVHLEESSTSPMPSDSHNQHRDSQHQDKRHDWLTLLARESLVNLKYLSPTQMIDLVYEGRTRRFILKSVLPERLSPQAEETRSELSDDFRSLSISSIPRRLWTVGWETIVVIDNERRTVEKRATIDVATVSTLDAYHSVGGLDKQIAQIRDLIEIPLTRPDLFIHLGLKPPRGILLHGPPGTGKTHLARAIAAATRASVLVVNGPELSSAYHGETESKLRDVFREARSKSPCIVVLDEVDALCPRREDGGGGEVEKRVVATLLTIMDGMEDADDNHDQGWRVVVVATTNRPNAIDPALRRPGRFDREIEIGIPDAPARQSILRVLLSKTPHSISEEELASVAARTHGYVGADLGAVIREAGTLAIKRVISNAASSDSTAEAPTLMLDDLLTALTSVRPSALREVFIETPHVLWSDIGGQSHVKQKLRECVEWPLRHPEAFARLGVRAPQGVLLYGPPGCSKTLTAKALATESGINFIAVKGPELLNKFVGESERAVREIFRKARAASPSIVFFDEIDALGTSRTDSGSGGAHEGVLTSLLNEMDGVQELIGVMVLAATNRPDVIDSALMRPGRLDRILYVGPPDLHSRIDILRIRTSKMAVDPELDIEELAKLTDGCSGAEIAAMCQDAALLTMQKDMDAPFVTQEAFVTAAKAVRRQITPEVVARFQRWRESSGLTDA